MLRRQLGGKNSQPDMMAKLPDSLAIALWITGSSWALAIAVCLLGGSSEWIFPLVMLGVLTGIAEWILRRKAG